MPTIHRRTFLASLTTLLALACGPAELPTVDEPEPPPPDLGPEPPLPLPEIPFDRGGGAGPGTTSGGGGATTSTTSGGPSGTTGEGPGALAELRLTEVLANPDGKDGGADSPEIIELVNLADFAVDLDRLTILARGWPRLDADDLGLDDRALAPGELLLLRRYASPEDAPWIGVAAEDGVLAVNLVTNEGLRNGDGAVLLTVDGDVAIDALIYGAPPPPSHDLPGAWIGAPVESAGAGVSLCRLDPAIDSDRADDWGACAPSPGMIEGDGGTTGDTDTGDTSSGGEAPVDATVVIVEVLSNAPGPSDQEKTLEYVEILNLGPDDVDLDGWTIADAIADDAPGRDPVLYREGDGGCAPQTCLAAGARALVVGGAYSGPTGGALVFETDDMTLADGGLTASEAVVLRRSDDTIASTYRVWDDPFADPYPINVEEPVHRQAVDLEDAPASWLLGPPTPGVE
ncbi:MAG: lamin tail domain-containing protein [Myxococcales bacterium]|nr:lamin tail domain-containing protein [Myxococcales bacterium]MCB9702538.1 lamin tail domain-containing protein [Myxococcales bacterium]